MGFGKGGPVRLAILPHEDLVTYAGIMSFTIDERWLTKRDDAS